MRRRAVLVVEYDAAESGRPPTAERWEDIIDAHDATRSRVEVQEDKAL